ncbi:MAG: Fe-S cluster assembly protein SufD [Crocinitomicaceae bacterium]
MSETMTQNKVTNFIKNLDVSPAHFQQMAAERLGELNFPTTKDEYWKYTRLGKLTKLDLSKTPDPDRLNLTKHIISNDYLVVVNGFIREDLSQYSKLDFEIDFLGSDRMSEELFFDKNLNKKDVFASMNSAFFEKVISIKIGTNKVNEGPLQIIYVSKGENVIANTRLYVEAAKSSQSQLIQTFISMDSSNSFTNHVTEAHVAENAHLKINKAQIESDSNSIISTEQIHQEANSVFKINTVTLSGALTRNNINIAVAGQNCETFMNGAIVTKNNEVVDNHTFVDHQVSNCMSDENYKYVLGGKSTGTFNGRVVVQKDAQVINAYQNNGNILLSDYAKINSKPELEIYADDVKCSHGSTTGQLDDEAIFYLQARGISKDNAKKLLVRAFIGEVIEAFENEHFENYINDQLFAVHGWNS